MNEREDDTEYGARSNVFPVRDDPQRQPRTASERAQALRSLSRGEGGNYSPDSLGVTIRK